MPESCLESRRGVVTAQDASPEHKSRVRESQSQVKPTQKMLSQYPKHSPPSTSNWAMNPGLQLLITMKADDHEIVSTTKRPPQNVSPNFMTTNLP
ncbi:hypothetical protein J6590_054351 [Homalodisca vitripennis]|nr:hypothetical protein J6590_054351 [Homalodisca vitripennis]